MKKRGSAVLFVMLAMALMATIGAILVQQHSLAQHYAIERGKKLQNLWVTNTLLMYGVAYAKEYAFQGNRSCKDLTLGWQQGRGQLTFEPQDKNRCQITAVYGVDNRLLGKSVCIIKREGNGVIQEQIEYRFH